MSVLAKLTMRWREFLKLLEMSDLTKLMENETKCYKTKPLRKPGGDRKSESRLEEQTLKDCAGMVGLTHGRVAQIVNNTEIGKINNEIEGVETMQNVSFDNLHNEGSPYTYAIL